MNIIFDVDGVLRYIKNPMINEIIPFNLMAQLSEDYQSFGLAEFVGKYLPMQIFKDWDKGLVNANEVLNAIIPVADEPKDIVEILFNAALDKKYNLIDKSVIKFAKECKRQGHKIYILSNMCIEVVEVIKTLIDFSMFDGVVFSCDVGMRKPELDFYKKALQRWKISAKESLFIDDSQKNLIPFEQLGGKTYLFSKNNKYNDDIQNLIYEK